MKIATADLLPIVIDEKKQSELFQALLPEDRNFYLLFTTATGKVLKIMLEENMTLIPERQAVWCDYRKIYGQFNTLLIEKIGRSFPNDDFGESCYWVCQGKANHTQENKEQITSYESRNPIKDLWGGSVQITFHLKSLTGDIHPLTFIGAPSGLKEWEDLALMLGTLYYLRLIKFEDQQVQEILHRTEIAVANDPTAWPEDITISEYVKLVFNTIDENILSPV